MSWRHVDEIARAGHEVQSHGGLRYLSRCSDQELDVELQRSKSELESHLVAYGCPRYLLLEADGINKVLHAAAMPATSVCSHQSLRTRKKEDGLKYWDAGCDEDRG